MTKPLITREIRDFETLCTNIKRLKAPFRLFPQILRVVRNKMGVFSALDMHIVSNQQLASLQKQYFFVLKKIHFQIEAIVISASMIAATTITRVNIMQKVLEKTWSFLPKTWAVFFCSPSGFSNNVFEDFLLTALIHIKFTSLKGIVFNGTFARHKVFNDLPQLHRDIEDNITRKSRFLADQLLNLNGGIAGTW